MRPRLLLVAIVCLGMTNASYGQMFPNAPWNRGAVQSGGCPGGVCAIPYQTPATRVTVPRQVLTVKPQQSVVFVEPLVQQETVSVTALGQRERGNFRRMLLDAARTARQSGDITDGQYYRLVAMSLRPASLDKIKDFVAASAVEDGLASTTAIDWDALLEFIEKLIPIIIQLIDLFS